MVAISPQVDKYSRQIKKKHELGFEILSDSGNEFAEKLGLKWGLPDYLIEIYNSFGIELPRYNGDESWTLPMPARYVVSSAGEILKADFDADYTRRPEPAETLEFLRDHISKNGK